MKNITIKILSDKEFDRLPVTETRGANISDSLGFADVHRNRIFVRQTGRDELNRLLIQHELEHLFELEGTDEDEVVEGIRHKKMPKTRQILGPIAEIAGPVVGNAILPGFGGAIGGAAGSAINKGIGGEKRTTEGILPAAAKGGVIGGVADLATGNFGMDSKTTNPLTRFGESFKSGFGIGNIMDQFKNMFGSGVAEASQAAAPILQTGTAFDPFTGKKNNPDPSGGGNQPPTQGNQQSSDSPLSRFFPGIDLKGILGAGALATGLFKGMPEVPELPQSAENYRMATNQGTEMGNLAQDFLKQNIDQQFEPLSDLEIQALTRQYEEAEKRGEDAIRDQYRSIRPGSDPTTDSALKRDLEENRSKYGQLRAEAVANRTRDVRNTFNQQKILQVQQALNANDAEMTYLQKVAQMDIERIMQQLNMDADQAALFKNTMLNLGTGLLFPGEESSPININIGGTV